MSTKTVDSAINILALKELDNIKDFYIMDSFAYTKGGELLSGRQAYSRFEQSQTEKILEEFIKAQGEIQALMGSKPFNC